MANNNKSIGESILEMITIETIQTYILGTKRNGKPRSLYDLFKGKKKHNKERKNSSDDLYSLYQSTKKNKSKKGKKGKKGKKNKHWKYKY